MDYFSCTCLFRSILFSHLLRFIFLCRILFIQPSSIFPTSVVLLPLVILDFIRSYSCFLPATYLFPVGSGACPSTSDSWTSTVKEGSTCLRENYPKRYKYFILRIKGNLRILFYKLKVFYAFYSMNLRYYKVNICSTASSGQALSFLLR